MWALQAWSFYGQKKNKGGPIKRPPQHDSAVSVRVVSGGRQDAERC